MTVVDESSTLIGADPAAWQSGVPTHEARSSERHPFQCIQRIGVVHDGRLPLPDELREVGCQDLSAGGVAILFSGPVEFDTCVVALGTPPQVTYFLARVVNVQPLSRVGCQFLQRLQLDSTGQLVNWPAGDPPHATVSSSASA